MYPSHQAIWANDLVENLKGQGYSLPQIVGNTGIQPHALKGNRAMISFDKLALLFERAAELTGDDLIGFRLGQGREFRRGGLVTFVGISSPTVKTLMQNVDRYQRLVSDAVRVDAKKLDAEGVVEWGYLVPQAVMRRQYLEFTATGFVEMLRRLTNRDIRLAKLELRYHRSNNTEALQHFFGCHVVYGSDENRMHLKRSDLDLPLRTSDIYLYETLKECCETALAQKQAAKTPIVVAVEREIARGHTAQASVATALGMSSRTLARRLSAEGQTYHAVLEGYREALSKNLIADTDLQMTEIAFLAGYSSLSTFSTAFRRWTDKSPMQYRSEQPSR